MKTPIKVLVCLVAIALAIAACTKDASPQETPTQQAPVADRLDFEIINASPSGHAAAIFTFKRIPCFVSELPVVNMNLIWPNGTTINSYMTWTRGGFTDCEGYILTPPQGGQWDPKLICKVMPAALAMGGAWPVVEYGGRSCWQRPGTTIRFPYFPLLYRPAQVQTGDQK